MSDLQGLSVSEGLRKLRATPLNLAVKMEIRYGKTFNGLHSKATYIGLFILLFVVFLVPSFIRRLTFSNIPKRNISFCNRLNASISRVSPNPLFLNIFWFVHVRPLCMSPPDLGSLPPQLPSGPQRTPAVEFTHEETEWTFWNRSALLLPVSPDFAAL